MKKLSEKILAVLTHLAAITTVSVLFFMIAFILINALPHFKLSLFEFNYNSDNVSMMPSIVATVIMTMMALLIATPLGIFSAVYLTEYANKKNRIVSFVRITTETLSGIPSIVYGLFGWLFFVTAFNLGRSILSGTLTLAIMILPLIMRSSEEALKAVPDIYRESAFGLGAGKLRVIFKVIFPYAIPGILSGVILAIGRIVGETAALIYTSGTVAQIPQLFNIQNGEFFYQQSARTLSVHMYLLSKESLHTSDSYVTAAVLLIVVFFINMASSFVANKFGGKK